MDIRKNGLVVKFTKNNYKHDVQGHLGETLVFGLVTVVREGINSEPD
jgi:hypothetical protein